MNIRVSQEFFQTMATPKFSAFRYVKMEFIEKIKFIKFEVIFFGFFKMRNPMKSENFTASYKIPMGVQGSAMVR